MLTSRCNTPTRHWLLLLGLSIRMILAMPMTALAPHSQASKSIQYCIRAFRRLGRSIGLVGRRMCLLIWMEIKFSVDCPGFDSQGPCGLEWVKCPTPEWSAWSSLCFERREQRLLRPPRSCGSDPQERAPIVSIEASHMHRDSNIGTEVLDSSHVPLPLPF